MLRETNGRYWHDDAEITASEYASLLDIAQTKTAWVNDIYAGRKSIDDCPAEWKQEVSERIEEKRNQPTDDPTAEEILEILTGETE